MPSSERLTALALTIVVPCCAPLVPVPLPPAPLPAPSASQATSAAPQAASALPAWVPPPLGAMRAIGEGPSKHAGGRYQARWFASDAAAFEADGDAPIGLELCAELREGREGMTLCMRKEPVGWRYGVQLVGAEGWSRVGELGECVACHSAAPRDGRF